MRERHRRGRERIKKRKEKAKKESNMQAGLTRTAGPVA